jgi:hypothetical protein
MKAKAGSALVCAALLVFAGCPTENQENPALEASVVITGSPIVGKIVKAAVSPAENESLIYQYAWSADGSPVGEDNETYTVQTADMGKKLKVKVTREGYSGEQISGETEAVFGGYKVETIAGPGPEKDMQYWDDDWKWDWKVGPFRNARSIALDSTGKYLYVSQTKMGRRFNDDRAHGAYELVDGRIAKVDLDALGSLADPADATSAISQFAHTWTGGYLAAHPTSGDVYYSRIWGKDVRKYSSDGGKPDADTDTDSYERDDGIEVAKDLTKFQVEEGTDGFDNALDGYLACASDGTLYVIDGYNKRILKIASDGTVSVFAQGLENLSGIAVDEQGNVYTGESYVSAIHKYTPAGEKTTVAHGWSSIDGKTGEGQAAGFMYINNLTVASDGVIYVLERVGKNGTTGDNEGGNVIRKVTQDGIVTTIAGKFADSGYTNNGSTQDSPPDGPGDGTADGAAVFSSLRDITVASDGTIYVLDNGWDDNNACIRKITKITELP